MEIEKEKNGPNLDKDMSRRGSQSNLEANIDSLQHSKSETSDQDKENNNNNKNAEDQPTSLDPNELSLPQLLEEVDQFLQKMSAQEENKLNSLEVPNCVELFSDKVDSMITNYQGDDSETKFGNNPGEDTSFVEALNRLSNLSDNFREISSTPQMVSVQKRTSSVLQRTMSFFDEEFRSLLEENPKSKDDFDKNNNNVNHITDQFVIEEAKPEEEQEFPSFSAETISKMNKIATAMISSGYETECCMLYSISRRNAFKAAINKLGHKNINIEDVQKMKWESIEGEIVNWITVVKQSSTIFFPGEHKLSGAVFSNHPSISQSLFSNLARAVAIQLLNFAEAIVSTKHLPEKLFKILDMYETLRYQIQSIDDSYPEEIAKDLILEVGATKGRLGEAAVSIFCTLENSIKSDNSKTPVPGGAVHPLTRYVVNYLKYACEYKDTLEQVFQYHLKDKENREKTTTESETKNQISRNNKNEGGSNTAPFTTELMSVMELLDTNLDVKSKLYKDPSLRFVFLMNNGRYILQKIKASTEFHQLVGSNWCRKRSSELRGYHKNYQRETWGKILQCLSHEGLQVNGKVSKVLLKERFKSFNAMFEEIHKTQSTWVVSDEQLQSELRVSVSAVMIPAYRSFLGRFKQHLDPGRQTDKYIKLQPDDIENFIDDLFDGNPMSTQKRKS